MSYKVRLPIFEGPFDLLVYLIENAEMDIYDIEISEITRQYLEYITTMKELNVVVATEFMVLAANLIEIKSKLLLPRSTGDSLAVMEDDPRKELVQKILEYKKVKLQAALLEEAFEINQSIYSKPQEDISFYLDNPDEVLSLDLEELSKAFGDFLARKQRLDQVKSHYTRLERERISTETKMESILEHLVTALKEGHKVLDFTELLDFSSSPSVDMDDFTQIAYGEEYWQNYERAVTFVALLQMVRNRQVDCEQTVNYGDIKVSLIEES